MTDAKNWMSVAAVVRIRTAIAMEMLRHAAVWRAWIVAPACDCDGNVADECGICGGDGSTCAEGCTINCLQL